ncbi:hypothetical protein LXL04_011721 [Taraxacum kok-saghyz]
MERRMRVYLESSINVPARTETPSTLASVNALHLLLTSTTPTHCISSTHKYRAPEKQKQKQKSLHIETKKKDKGSLNETCQILTKSKLNWKEAVDSSSFSLCTPNQGETERTREIERSTERTREKGRPTVRDKEEPGAREAGKQRNREAAGQQLHLAAVAVDFEGEPPPAAVVVVGGGGFGRSDPINRNNVKHLKTYNEVINDLDKGSLNETCQILTKSKLNWKDAVDSSSFSLCTPNQGETERTREIERSTERTREKGRPTVRDKEEPGAREVGKQRNREAAGQQLFLAAVAVDFEGEPPPAAVVVVGGGGFGRRGGGFTMKASNFFFWSKNQRAGASRAFPKKGNSLDLSLSKQQPFL